MTSSEEKRSLRPWLLAGLAIGLVGLGIRIWLHQEPVNSDDVQYFAQATSDEPGATLATTANANGMRLALLSVPAALSAIFGPSKLAFYATVYTFALVSFFGLFAFAWVLSGIRIALIASAVWATSYSAIFVDTRLAPDNLGAGLALLGLALIALAARVGPRSSEPDKPRSDMAIIACAVVGGFLLWAAFSTRASFVVFGGLGAVFAVFSRRRWYMLGLVLAGLAIGEIIELLYFEVAFGDALTRWKYLLGYKSNVAASGTSGGIYSGYTLSHLVTRYPEMLIGTNWLEAAVHFAGLAVFLAWAIGWREPRSRLKLLCGLGAYGFIAFAIVSIDPIVPLLRDKLRYYAAAAPLFYLAAAELIYVVVYRHVRRPPLDKWLNGRARQVALGSLVILALLINVWQVGQSASFAKNGNDALLSGAEYIQEDAEEGPEQRPKVVYTDFRTQRVTNILLPKSDGWQSDYAFDAKNAFIIPENGYLLSSWKRLNTNLRRGYTNANRSHGLYRIIEKNAVVGRHRLGLEMTDVYFLGASPIDRQPRPITGGFPQGWSRYRHASKSWEALGADEKIAITNKRSYQEHIYSGTDAPWQPRPETSLAGDVFVETVVKARFDGKKPRQLRAYLRWWPEGNKKYVTQYMGRVYVGNTERDHGLWTYLPQPARSYRIILRAQVGIVLSDVQTYVLQRHEADRIQQDGGAW